MAMYILGFMLFVSIFLERVGHTDFDPPEYLPLDLSSQSLFLEAVTRSRTKPKAKKKNTKKFPSIHKFTKKNQYNSDDNMIFEDGRIIFVYYYDLFNYCNIAYFRKRLG